MTRADIEFDSFISHGLAEAHPALHEWYGDDLLRENFRAALELDLAALDDEAGARRLAEKHPTDAVSHEAYGPRVIEIEPDHRVIAQICFEADSLTFPHVLVKHRDFAIDSTQRVASLRQRLREAFCPFDIERIWVYMHASGDCGKAGPPADQLGMHLYKRYLAAPFRTIIDNDPPPNADRVRMQPTFEVDFYDMYSKTYDTVWERAPALRDLVRKETFEDFERYARADGLRLAYIDGERAGIVAAHPEVEHGLRGWCMHERLIYTPFRGKGFGPAVLWHFIRSLPAEPEEVLYGTIVPPNRPSMRSALKMGRIDVGASYWIHTGR